MALNHQKYPKVIKKRYSSNYLHLPILQLSNEKQKLSHD